MHRIIIKFTEGGNVSQKDGKFTAEHVDLSAFNQIVETIPNATCTRCFSDEAPKLLQLTAEAAKRSGKSIPSPSLFFDLQPGEAQEIDWLVKELRAFPGVEQAAVALEEQPFDEEEQLVEELEDPLQPQRERLVSTSRNFELLQGYKTLAPAGIDAVTAEQFEGGAGEGVRVCVCEGGFHKDHEDLPEIQTIIPQVDPPVYGDHGTATLGILFGVNNSRGVTGICHGATALFASTANVKHGDAIFAAIDPHNPHALKKGDVLVLELQSSHQNGRPLPAEADPCVHAACRVATSLGIIVVAAAGNGNFDLDETPDSFGRLIWKSTIEHNPNPCFDSGALMVGGGVARLGKIPRSKMSSSCFGGRVNCQGWGDSVTSAGYGSLAGEGNSAYTSRHHGTSSATAIVAGAVACLQGIYKAANDGETLPPDEMRRLFSNPNNGSPQVATCTRSVDQSHIGPQPDLSKLITAIGGGRRRTSE